MQAEVIPLELEKEFYFEAAERKFYELTKTLQKRDTLKMDFSDIEKLLEKDGRE